MADISIIVGGCGFIGSQIVRSLSARGDNVLVIDQRSAKAVGDFQQKINIEDENCAEKIISFASAQIFDKLNIIFCQMFEEANYRAVNQNNQADYREQVRRLWVKSDSGDFTRAIRNQIELPDKILRELTKFIVMHQSRILFIGSSFGKYSRLINSFANLEEIIFKHPSYGLSKNAVEAYVPFLVDIFHGSPVKVNCLSLGVVDRAQTDKFASAIKNGTAYRNRLVGLSDVCRSVSFMLSENSEGIHGQIIHVNNGWFG